MSFDPLTLAAILAMAAATYMTRLSGVWIASRFVLKGRLRAAVDALPASILIALIAPLIAGGGPAGLLAGAVTILAARNLPLIVVVLAAIASAALFRNVL